MTRDDMINELRTRNCRVIFTKTNGEERDMVCTLVEETIPEANKPKVGGEYNQEVIRVWDVNAEGWRSFRVDAVKSFT